ncbi:hypothetical protein ACVMDN_001938 [Bradyrhizobium sp. USDA 4510]
MRAMSWIMPEVLHKNFDGAARRIVAVEHMRHAVLEHPGIAGGGGDHLIDLADVEPLLGGEGDRLGGGRDMHAGQQLVDHLERGALPRGIAELVELCRHRIQRRPRLRKCRGAAGGENRQFALRRALRAAGDRGIEIVPAGRLELLCEAPRDIRVHGRRGDEDRVLGQGLGDAVLAEQDPFSLRRVDDDADDNVGIPGRLGRRLGALAAVGDEARHRIGRDVAAGHLETGPPE